MDQEPTQQKPKQTIEIKIKPSFSKSQEKIGGAIGFSINALVIFWGSLIKITIKWFFQIFGYIVKTLGRFLHIKITEWADSWVMFFKLPPVLLMWSIVSILCVFSLMAGTQYGSDQAWNDFKEARYEQY